jgi:PTH1 family peptidyl-tRNA hydrolase
MNTQSLNFDISKIKAIIGLGNPGPAYYKTRHSIGFRIADAIAQHFNISLNTSDEKEYAQIKTDHLNIYLVKPLTFMNNSGKVIPFLQKKGIKADEILVIHDELEKEFGYTNLKFGGSAKGHNGLRSIIEFIGPDFWRLRFGISRPNDKAQVGNYVLTNFSKDEEARIPELIEDTIKLILAS